MCVIYFQSSESSRSIEINTTSDPKIVSLTSGYHGFIVDVDSGKVMQKLNTALHKYSKQFVFVTKRNGNYNLYQLSMTLLKIIRQENWVI